MSEAQNFHFVEEVDCGNKRVYVIVDRMQECEINDLIEIIFENGKKAVGYYFFTELLERPSMHYGMEIHRYPHYSMALKCTTNDTKSFRCDLEMAAKIEIIRKEK